MSDEGQTPEERHDEEAREHIRHVRHWLFAAGRDLRERADKHDADEVSDYQPEYWYDHDPYARAPGVGPLVSSMSLNGIMEMLCDWKASAPDYLPAMVDDKCDQYGISLQLKAILLNTANELGMLHESKPAFLVTTDGSTLGERPLVEADVVGQAT